MAPGRSAWLGTPANLFGVTSTYDDHPDGSDVTPCAHCAESFGDWCFAQEATPECVDFAVDGQDGNVLKIEHFPVSDTEVKVKLDVIGNNPCEDGDVPAIDVDLTIHFRQSCTDGEPGPMEFRLYGDHDGFPWHELYINGVAVYRHDPCLTQDTPSRLFDPLERNFTTIDAHHPLLLGGQTPLDQWQAVPGIP